MDNVTIQSSCGHTLLPGQTATLTEVIDSPSPQNYRFMWQKKNLKGELLNWVEYGQTIQINSDEVSEDITYIVSVIGGQDIITDSSNNILIDTTGNILTASFNMMYIMHRRMMKLFLMYKNLPFYLLLEANIFMVKLIILILRVLVIR